MITRESCKGVWVPIMAEWDERDAFDVDMFVRNAERLVKAGVHTIYTTGTDGEFYAMTEEEFRLMVDALVAVTKGTATTHAIGTNAANTRDVLRLIDYCASRNVDAVMPTFPFWLAVNEAEWKEFMRTMFRVAAEVPVIFYNTERSKKTVSATEFKALVPEMPAGFVGTKTTSFDFFQYCEYRSDTPDLVHIVLETIAVPALMSGGKAFISAILGAMNPKLAVEWYNQCERGEWEAAMAFQLKLNEYEHKVINGVARRSGYRAGRLSKALTRIGGFNETHHTMRKPYHCLPDAMVDTLRAETLKYMPELINE